MKAAKQKTPRARKARGAAAHQGNDHYFERLLEDAEDAASKTPGERLLRRFIRAARAGENPAQADMQSLTDSLEKILAGMPPKKALGLERGKVGRKEPTVADAEPRIALAMRALLEIPKSTSERAACARVARATGIPAGTVRGYLQEYRSAAQFMLRMEDEEKLYRERGHEIERMLGRERIQKLTLTTFAAICKCIDAAATPTEQNRVVDKLRLILQPGRRKT